MPIHLECDECGKKYRVPDERAGEWIECRECGADIEVPDEWDEGPRRPQRSSGRSRSSGGRRASGATDNTGLSPATMAAIGGGSFALLLIVSLILVFSGGGDERPRPHAGPGNRDELANAGQRVPSGSNGPPIAQPATPVPPPGGPQIPQPPVRPGVPSAPVVVNVDAVPRAGAATNWRVSVDAPPQPEIDPEAEPVEEVDTSKPLTITFPDGNYSSNALVMPSYPSGLVVLGANGTERQMREFWNVKTGKRVGVMQGMTFSPHKQAVSPGGGFYAATSFATPGVLVWDVQKKKALGELPLTEDGKRPSDMPLLAIPSAERIIAVAQKSVSGKYVARVNIWELPSGDPLKAFDVEGGMNASLTAFTPAGRYLLFRGKKHDSQLVVYDLTTGTKAGDIPSPSHSASLVNHKSEPKAAAFSDDGRKLAVAFKGGKYQIAVYDVATGKPTDHIDVPGDLTNGGPRESREIQWFPGNEKLLLLGQSIISLQSDSIVHTFEKPKRDHGGGMWITGQDQVGRLTGDSTAKGFTLVKVDDAAISEQQERMARGETAEDEGLPSLTNPVVGQVKIASESGVGTWTLDPDPASSPHTSLIKKPVKFKSSGDVRGGRARLLIAGDAARAALHCDADRRSLPTGATGSLSSIDVIDLTNGQRSSSLGIDFPCAALAISPDGTRVITRGGQTDHRLDVWDLDAGKHVVGWKPAIAKWPESDELKRVMSRGVRRIDSAVFVDSNHVLTASNEAAVLWKLPECQAVYLIPRPRQYTLSPGRKYLICGSTNRSVNAFDSLTGEQLGSLSVNSSIDSIAIHPDGNRLAMSDYFNSGRHLFVVDWKSGEVTTRFPIPKPPMRIRWMGDSHILMLDGSLIDLTKQLVVWRYQIGTGVSAQVPPDTRLWTAGTGLRAGSPTTLAAWTLPDSAVSNRLSQANLKVNMLMEPGSTVSIQANVSTAPPGRPNLQATLNSKLAERLEKSGLKVAGNARFTAVASLALNSTGKTETYITSKGNRSPFLLLGRRPDDAVETQVTEQELVFSVKLVTNGTTIWEGPPTSVRNTQTQQFETKDNESIQEYLDRTMWSHADSMFSNVTFPDRVFDPATSSGFGKSTLLDGRLTISDR